MNDVDAVSTENVGEDREMMPDMLASQEQHEETYHSCEYIEGGIVFYPNRLTACCVTHSKAADGGGGQPVLTEFHGGDFPIEKIEEWRRQTIEGNKRGEFHRDCKGCPLLIKRAWGRRQEHSINMITIAHFSHCNLRCNYCYTVLLPELTIKPKKVYDLLPIFQQMIETRVLSPTAEIRFSGGEPTVLGEFEDLLDLVSAYGPRIRIYTNAVVRSEAILRALSKRRVELVLGIDAGSDEVYKQVKGRNVNKQVWDNVAAYVAVDPTNCWAKMIVRQENLSDVVAFVDRCEQSNVRKVYYDLDANLQPTDGNKLADKYVEALALLKYECEKRGVETSSAEVGSNSCSNDSVFARVEQVYDQLAQRDSEAGQRVQFLRQMEQSGIDWRLYAHVLSKMGVNFAPTVESIFGRV